jgi:predicted phosphodiesterase
MNVLGIADSHTSGKNPPCRKDDLIKVQFDKWEEIVGIANINGVPIVHAGDLTHSSLLSNSLMAKLGDIFNSLHNPLYFVWGNHDLLYHSLDIWDQTALGVLWKNNKNIKHISEFEGDYGVTWDWIDWNQSITNNKAKYLLSHKAVVSDNHIKRNKWIEEDTTFAINCKDKSLKNIQIIVCGHWHKRYIIKRRGINTNTIIINPGPMARRST